ncbi:MAG TPA: DUF6340 family protein [Prolixibacteraceae bacterium]|nr:DUF6340 family protein [Prolixibacteraceae bacterium]
MKHRYLLPVIFILGFLQSCNTLYNTTLIDLEIIEPAKVIFPPDVKKIAVRYNNSNISYNPFFAKYATANKTLTDPENSDSLAAEIYYNRFLERITHSGLFESVIAVSPSDYSNVNFDLSLLPEKDSANLQLADPHEKALYIFSKLHKKYTPTTTNKSKTVEVDPHLALYTESELEQIADTTQANLLLSFDYFGVIDEIVRSNTLFNYNSEFVVSLWNFYDLNEKKLKYFYHRMDTIYWDKPDLNYEKLPTRTEAMLNAAEIAGERFSDFLAPNWVDVHRTFYRSGHIEMKQAQQLADENKWLEAAEIWKKNSKNANKNIAAKSMYNLAVACEISGNLEAALDWLVRSYHVFGNKNEVHAFNCQDYIRILARRQLDFKKINLQLNPEGL